MNDLGFVVSYGNLEREIIGYSIRRAMPGATPVRRTAATRLSSISSTWTSAARPRGLEHRLEPPRPGRLCAHGRHHPRDSLTEKLERARIAARTLATTASGAKDAGLEAIAQAVEIGGRAHPAGQRTRPRQRARERPLGGTARPPEARRSPPRRPRRRRPGCHRPARPGRRSAARLDPAERRAAQPGTGSVRSCRRDLRGPPERHDRHRSPRPQERQRRRAARRVGRREHQPRSRRAAAGGARERRTAGGCRADDRRVRPGGCEAAHAGPRLRRRAHPAGQRPARSTRWSPSRRFP